MTYEEILALQEEIANLEVQLGAKKIELRTELFKLYISELHKLGTL